MSCTCSTWDDCSCTPSDPTYDYEEGKVYCANCFGTIGELCDRCCEGER